MKSRNWWQKERWLLHGSIIFYCLAYTGQTHVPTREYERDELKNAGLALEIKMQYWILMLAKKCSKVIYWIFFPI